jgi:photosynthetic reaction center H subunit
MTAGAIVAHFDVAQIAIYAFWLFFFSLIFYLRREDHREGYPLVPDYPGQAVMDYPPLPTPKTFLLADGHEVLAPRAEAPEIVHGERALPWAGAPFEPVGDPMIVGFGAAAYAMRADVPEHAYDDGLPKIVPLRSAGDFFIATEDADPRGFRVFGLDSVPVGTIVDTWIDRSEYIVRYLEVELDAEFGARRVLLPMHFAKLRPKAAAVHVNAITGAYFATVPGTQNPDVVTSREEDRISAYYAGGLLYATPARRGPLL